MDTTEDTIVTTFISRDTFHNAELNSEENLPLLSELSLKPRDRYKFIRTIGIGGMKTVLLVYDKDTRRNVALAMMPDFNNRSNQELSKFINEALITAKLEHPNIVPIHDIGLDSNMSPYFVMTFLSGMMLSSLLSRMKNGDEEILRFYYARKMLLNFQKICHAVEFAHSQNILHLDLKPANVHIGKYGEVQVLDWGLARVMDKDLKQEIDDKKNKFLQNMANNANQANNKHVALGTPGFMAPEQALGKELDCRADVYSLGAILFSILMLRSPTAFLPNTDTKTILKATIDGSIINDVEMINESRPIPPALEAICRKAMATNPSDRYQTVKALRDDIGNYLSNYPTLAESPVASRKMVLFVKRNALRFTIFSALLIFAAIAVAFAYFVSSGKIVLNF